MITIQLAVEAAAGGGTAVNSGPATPGLEGSCGGGGAKKNSSPDSGGSGRVVIRYLK